MIVRDILERELHRDDLEKLADFAADFDERTWSNYDVAFMYMHAQYVVAPDASDTLKNKISAFAKHHIAKGNICQQQVVDLYSRR